MEKSVRNTINSIMEVAQPLSQGEINFKALHGEVKPTNRDMIPGITDQDFIFNGNPRKDNKLPASYQNGENDASKDVYDKTLKVTQNYYPQKEVGVKEEVEAVDEAMKGEEEYEKRYGPGGKKRKDSETEEGGAGRHKVNYTHPDKKNIGNDRFDTKHQATSYANDLKKKGYHDVNVTEEVEAVDEAMKGEDEYNARYGKCGKKRSSDEVENSYMKNKEKVLDKYKNNNKEKEVSEPVKEEMKGEAEYNARYGKGGKKKPNPDKTKEKTDWKEILTRKKEVSEEFESIEEEIYSTVKTFVIGEYGISVQESSNIYCVINPVTEDEYFTEDYYDACDTAKAILRTIVKEAIEEEEAIALAEKTIDVQKAMYARYVPGKFTKKPNPNKLKGNQKVLDKNHNGHLDKQDFEMLRKEEAEELEEKNWIAGAIKHPGALKAAAKRAGETTSEYEQEHKHDSGKAGKRARLALTLKKMHENYDDSKEEVSMVTTELKSMIHDATELLTKMPSQMHVEPWVQAKVAMAKASICSIHDYIVYGNVNEEVFHEGAKVDRMEKHIENSEIESGKSPKVAKQIAWATINKRGMLKKDGK